MFQKDEKGHQDLYFINFLKYHLYGTNLSNKNWIVQSKIIHVVLMIFHLISIIINFNF
jgi:hypothetical protein